MRRARVVAGVIAVAAIGLAIAAFLSDGPETGGIPGPPPIVHCNGERMPFDAALSDAPYSVALPADTLASADKLAGTWDCPGTTTLMAFTSGVSISADVNTIEDPLASWVGVVEGQQGKSSSVGEVQGEPALLIDPEKAEPDNPALGGVTVVVDGVYVLVVGDGTIPLKELVAAAEALEVHSKA